MTGSRSQIRGQLDAGVVAHVQPADAAVERDPSAGDVPAREAGGDTRAGLGWCLRRQAGLAEQGYGLPTNPSGPSKAGSGAGEVVARRRPGSGRTALLTWAAAAAVERGLPVDVLEDADVSDETVARLRALVCVAAMSVAAAVALGGLSLTSGAIGSPWIREGSNAVDCGLPHLEAATNLVG